MTPPEQRVAVVTGATGGMGRVIALALVHQGMHVVTIARDTRRGEELRSAVSELNGAGSIEFIAGDLSHRAGIIATSAAIRARHKAMHVLMNNAGAHFTTHRLSPDGIEMHIAIDYLAAYGLTTLLVPELRRGQARVVNVASDTLRDTRQVKLLRRPRPATLEVDQLTDLAALNPQEDFAPFQAYARAKLLTVTAGYALSRTLAGEVTINAVHPGIVATDIIADIVPRALRPLIGILRRLMLTPEEGASAALRLALDPALEGVTGRYFVRDVETATPTISYRTDIQALVCETSDRFLGITHDGPK